MPTLGSYVRCVAQQRSGVITVPPRHGDAASVDFGPTTAEICSNIGRILMIQIRPVGLTSAPIANIRPQCHRFRPELADFGISTRGGVSG